MCRGPRCVLRSKSIRLSHFTVALIVLFLLSTFCAPEDAAGLLCFNKDLNGSISLDRPGQYDENPWIIRVPYPPASKGYQECPQDFFQEWVDFKVAKKAFMDQSILAVTIQGLPDIGSETPKTSIVTKEDKEPAEEIKIPDDLGELRMVIAYEYTSIQPISHD